MSDIAISLSNVSKKYSVTYEKPNTVGNLFGRKTIEKFWALKNINLKINRGDNVGIIGPNGAGKTTLLKIIAGITEQTTGKVTTHGKIVALMNLNAGFHPEMNGVENIYLNGMLIGMKKPEIKRKYNRIVDFADIGKFIHAPFYTYSGGMRFRLAFSIAIASKCDILIMDEIFVAGDMEFQQKTISEIKNLQKKPITTITCSHAPLFIWGFSDIFYELKSGVLKPKTKQDVSKQIKSRIKKWYRVLEFSDS